MLRQIPARLEITILSIATRWMSESHLAQKILLEAYGFRRTFASHKRQTARQAVLVVSAAWLVGFIVGILTY